MARRQDVGAAGSGEGGSKARGMWFRHRRRSAELDLSALDRLGELVGRIVALLPEQSAKQEPRPPLSVHVTVPAPAPVIPESAARTKPPHPVAPPVALHFFATPSGYRLLESDGAAAARGDSIELADGSFRVLRLGPSPLPGDRRRCAFLEREEHLAEARTPDG